MRRVGGTEVRPLLVCLCSTLAVGCGSTSGAEALFVSLSESVLAELPSGFRCFQFLQIVTDAVSTWYDLGVDNCTTVPSDC